MDGIENILTKATKKHCAAFIRGWSIKKILFRKRIDDNYIIKQGTITFVEYQGECYGITNQHVIGENWRERLEKESLLMALETHKFVVLRPIFVSPPSNDTCYPPHFPKDIAIYSLTNNREKLLRADKQPIILPVSMPKIENGEIVLAVGFPGSERERISEKVAGHR